MIDKATVYRALAITFAGMIIVAVPAVIIETTNHNVGFLASLFESVSAFSTTGLTTGITSTLNIASKLALVFAMFAGRVGPVSLASGNCNPKRKTFQFCFVGRQNYCWLTELFIKSKFESLFCFIKIVFDKKGFRRLSCR